MKEKKRAIGSNLKKVDAYVLGPKDYEEFPERPMPTSRAAYGTSAACRCAAARSRRSQASGEPAARRRRARALPPHRRRLAEPHQCRAAQGGEAAGGEAEEGVRVAVVTLRSITDLFGPLPKTSDKLSHKPARRPRPAVENLAHQRSESHQLIGIRRQWYSNVYLVISPLPGKQPILPKQAFYMATEHEKFGE